MKDSIKLTLMRTRGGWEIEFSWDACPASDTELKTRLQNIPNHTCTHLICVTHEKFLRHQIFGAIHIFFSFFPLKYTHSANSTTVLLSAFFPTMALKFALWLPVSVVGKCRTHGLNFLDIL
jgi:hypothetical protein